MIDILFGETNFGKTGLAFRWHPNAIGFGLEVAVGPQLRRVLGIKPRRLSSWAHKQAPAPGVSHARLYKTVNGGVTADGKELRGGQKYGFVALMHLLETHYGTLRQVCEKRMAVRGEWPFWPSFDYAHAAASTPNPGTIGLWQISGASEKATGGWHIPEASAQVFTDVICDDTQFLCRDAVDAHFRTPITLDDEVTPLEVEVMGNALKYKNEVGKQSAKWLSVIFGQLQRMDGVNWVFTTHRRAAGVADMGEKGSIVYGGGPEFFTGGQIAKLTGYVSNSIMLRGEDLTDEEAEAMPWMRSPVAGFHTWASYLPPEHPLASSYQTKQRGPFWAESPSGIVGLYYGSGQPIESDLAGYEWIQYVVSRMLDVAPVSFSGGPAEWAQLWKEMSAAGTAAFKLAREADLVLVMSGKSVAPTASTGCSFADMTRFDLLAQLNWALHEGYAAFVARMRAFATLGEHDLFAV